MKKLALIFSAAMFIGCSDDDGGCKCNGALYKHAVTGEIKSWRNEPMNCKTDEPIEPVKDDVWFYQECKQNPDY